MRNFIAIAAALLVTSVGVTARADTVTCADGTTSTAGRGACGHHGGIARKTTSRTKETEARNRTTKSTRDGAPVQCADGSSSTAGRGACGHHGGVARSTEARTDATSAGPERDRVNPTPKADSRDADAVEVQCADGTSSTSMGRGACSRHGGIARSAEARTPSTRRTSPAPTGRTSGSVQCEDGTMSTSKGRGACSHHGGVADGATARCADGTLSNSSHHMGTCSHHGGVSQWLF